jgi:hypothetical protein
MTGELVHGDGGRAARPYLLLPPEQAAIEALAAYLRRATFVMHEGTPNVDELSRAREFGLASVTEDFPDGAEDLTYPAASLVLVGEAEHGGGFTPSAVADTWDPVKGTVLWYLGETRGLLQLDLFADSKPVAQAITARLPELFNPNEGMSGMYLRAPDTYASATVRYLLLSHGPRTTLETAAANERRISATIRWEAPLYALRCARPLALSQSTEVT